MKAFCISLNSFYYSIIFQKMYVVTKLSGKISILYKFKLLFISCPTLEIPSFCQTCLERKIPSILVLWRNKIGSLRNSWMVDGTHLSSCACLHSQTFHLTTQKQTQTLRNGTHKNYQEEEEHWNYPCLMKCLLMKSSEYVMVFHAFPQTGRYVTIFHSF